MKNIDDPRPEDIREALAWERKTEPMEFCGGDELHPPSRVPQGAAKPHDREALEAESWYQDWLKRKAAK